MRIQFLYELSVVGLFLDELFISQFSVLRVSYMCILFDFDSYFLRFLKGLLHEILACFTWPIDAYSYCSSCSCLIFLDQKQYIVLLFLRNPYIHTSFCL
jgi:hypothetical protein